MQLLKEYSAKDYKCMYIYIYILNTISGSSRTAIDKFVTCSAMYGSATSLYIYGL